jgi:predicted enzyme related to lactoylglutathione lyase
MMTDPLDALRLPIEPVDPDPIFAARLKDRLRRAVLGGAMTEATHADLAWPPTLTPYIAVSDARRAIDWYVDVLDAHPRGEPFEMPDGSIGHAELGVGDAVLMLSEGSDQAPVQPPEPGRKFSHTIHATVDDVDDTMRRARERGAQVEREPRDEPYGRVAVFVDPFGHRWLLNQPPARATRLRQGDVSYITMVVADDERAKTFYGAVLGWRFSPGTVPRGWNVDGVQPMLGLWGDPSQHPEIQLCYRVADVEAAADRVRAHGGRAGEVDRKPYGLLVDCVDDQGARFQLWQPPD